MDYSSGYNNLSTRFFDNGEELDVEPLSEAGQAEVKEIMGKFDNLISNLK